MFSSRIIQKKKSEFYQREQSLWSSRTQKSFSSVIRLENISSFISTMMFNTIICGQRLHSSLRFMGKHVCGLYELIRSNLDTNKQKNWREVESRVKTQLPLRIMSCVQLASKLTSHYKVGSYLYTIIYKKENTLLFKQLHILPPIPWSMIHALSPQKHIL